MAWTLVDKDVALQFCQTNETVLLDDYSDIIEGMIFRRYRYHIGIDEFTEIYDGTGNEFLELRQHPIVSISNISLTSPLYAYSDLVDIHNDILIRGRFIKRASGLFTPGIGNLTLTYEAGTEEVDERLQLAELAALNYLVKFFIANRGDDSIKFMSAPSIGANQYSNRPGVVRKIIDIMDDLVPRKIRFA